MKDFWRAFNRWWNRITPAEIDPHNIIEIEIIFGIYNSNKFTVNLNVLLLLAKQFIHDCKMINRPISFLSFLVLVRQELHFEEQICIKNQCENNFNSTWSWLYDEL